VRIISSDLGYFLKLTIISFLALGHASHKNQKAENKTNLKIILIIKNIN